ncbi:MAG TPA: D-amino acid dehydrogenase [Burkholderiales bacterium]|nr:D-amino acid dehydrogenase [Burkholderiales bacterium]
MKVLILGGGVVGVASAYYLNQAGHEITVIDRADAVGRETSFANGGQISWGAGDPWAAPGIAWTAFTWLFKPHSPLVLRPRLDPAMWSWMLRFLRNATPERYAINRERMLRLARYSHVCLKELRQETGIKYEQQTGGTLVLFRTQKDLDKAAVTTALLDRFGVPYQMLSRSGCLAHEPALKAVREKIVGGIHYPEDESGDCHLFTLKLAQLAEKSGVRFQLQTRINRLETTGEHVTGVITDSGKFSADAYVVACGSYSPLLLRPLGIRLPVYPLKGYSITIPVTNPNAAPSGTLSDETYKVVITRLGDRLRAAGTAELAGYNLSLPKSRCATLEYVVRDLFPDAGDFTRAEYWTGLRPMTPDNQPVIGATPFRNLFLNTGHGTLGWTMSCGSGKVLADLVSGRRPDIDLDGLTLARFS